MELFFKKVFEVEPDDLDILNTLNDIQKKQFVLVAEAIWGVDIDFDKDFLERHEEAFEEIFELGVKFLHVFDVNDQQKVLYDVWSDNIDCVHLFHHNSTDEAGAVRIQGDFDPKDPENAEDVILAEALEEASLKSTPEDRP
jgi:hypothetical protein